VELADHLMLTDPFGMQASQVENLLALSCRFVHSGFGQDKAECDWATPLQKGICLLSRSCLLVKVGVAEYAELVSLGGEKLFHSLRKCKCKPISDDSTDDGAWNRCIRKGYSFQHLKSYLKYSALEKVCARVS